MNDSRDPDRLLHRIAELESALADMRDQRDAARGERDHARFERHVAHAERDAERGQKHEYLNRLRAIRDALASVY